MAQISITDEPDQHFEISNSSSPKINSSFARISEVQNSGWINKSKFLTAPQNILLSNDPFPSKAKDPHPNSYFIIPFWKVFYWSLLVPDKIEFDGESGRFLLKRGKSLNRFFSLIWLLLMTIYMSLIFFNDLEDKQSIKVIVSKATWACYALFDVTVIACLRFNAKQIAKLLSEGNKISNLCEALSDPGQMSERKKSKVIKYAIYFTSFIGVAFTVAFVLVVILPLTAVSTNLYNIFLELTDGQGHNYCSSKSDILCNLYERFTTNVFASILLTFWSAMAFCVELIWVAFFMMTASWAHYFKRLIEHCIRTIEDFQIDMNEGIELHSKITSLIEEFNKIFGCNLLWLVIASVLYAAATIGDILAGYNNGLWFDTINGIGFLPFIATLYTGSELHRTGHLLPSVIKKHCVGLRFRDSDQTLQILHGTTVVQYDALSNTIGLKAAGFFTISYQFVGNLVGVIITYSLINVQFKLGEIPLE